MTAAALAVAVLALGLAAISLLHSIAIRQTMHRNANARRMATHISRRKAELDEHIIPLNGHEPRKRAR